MYPKDQNYIIGVDGGGTKTVAVLADLNGKILKIGKSNTSNPRNVGIEIAIENIIKAIKDILPKNRNSQILSIFIGLSAVEEEFRLKVKKIQKELLKEKKISQLLKGEIKIVSDQLIAFKSGTEEKDGIVLIAGTGCVAHGWREEKEFKVSGWGWLADEGSGFWIGQRIFQAILKTLDKRRPKTLLVDFAFRKLGLKKQDSNLLNQKIYTPDFIKRVSSLSSICDTVAQKKDKIAKKILVEAGNELVSAVKTVIKELGFFEEKFPLVLVGGLFKSKVILDVLKKEIKKIAPKARFIIPQKEPVIGAIKMGKKSRKNQNL